MVAVYIGFHLLGELRFGAWGKHLSLGQGLYFGMGAYIVAWSLKLQQAAIAASEAAEPELAKLDRYILKPGVMTDYMEQCRLPEVPSPSRARPPDT